MSSPSQRTGQFGGGGAYTAPAPGTPVIPPPQSGDETWTFNPRFSSAYLGENQALYESVKSQNLHADPELAAFGRIGNGASRTPGGVADTYALNYLETKDPYWLEGALQIVEPYIRYFKGESQFDPRRYRRFTYNYDSLRKRVTTPGNTVASGYVAASQRPSWNGEQGNITIPASERAALGYRTVAQSQGRVGFLKFIYWRFPPPNLETAQLMGVSYEHALDVGQTLSWFARVILLATHNQNFQRSAGKLSTAEIARVGYDVVLDTFEAFEYRKQGFYPAWGVYRFGSAVEHGFVNVASFYMDADALWRFHNGGEPHEKISSGAKSLESWIVESMYKVRAPNGGDCVVYPHQNPRVQNVFGGARYNPATGPHLTRYTAELENDVIKLSQRPGSRIDASLMAALANNQSQIWFSAVTQKNGRPYAQTGLCVDGGGGAGGGRFQNGQLLPDTPLITSKQIVPSDTADGQERAYFSKGSGGLFVGFDATPNQENVKRWNDIANAFPSAATETRIKLCRLYRAVRRR